MSVTGSPRAVVGVLGLTGVLAALQGTIMLPLISHLPEIYDVDAMQASWIITATLLAGALATPVVSRLADMFGKRRLIIVALVIMVAGCLLLALVHVYAVAIVGRAMQGVTASVLPVALSVLKDVMPPERVGSGIAIVSATLGIGSAAGLPLAGLMYGQLGFSSLFWLTGGLAALLALASWRFLPRSSPTGRRRAVRPEWGRPARHRSHLPVAGALAGRRMGLAQW